MNTIKCLLLDDELPGLTYLRRMCESIAGVEVVRAFNDPLKLLEERDRLDFDICILDIEMPGLNGLQVAAALEGKPVIFTTAYHEYAADAFDLDAVDYLRKPIQLERLQKALEKARQRLLGKPVTRPFFQWNTNKGKNNIFFDQLLYITTSDTDKRDKLALFEGGSELVIKNISFDQLRAVLPARQFCRVSKKDILALRAVRFFSADEIITSIVLPGGRELRLLLGDSYRKDFQDAFLQR